VKGTSATFSVVASGTPPIGYQWQKGASANGPFANLTDNARVSGSVSNALSISGLGLADAGYYQVVLTSSYGAVTSSVAQLVVATAGLIQATNGFGGSASVGSVSTTLPSATVAGNLIVVWTRWGTDGPTGTITDSLGNTWIPVSDKLASTAHGADAQMFYAINSTSGPDTLTLTLDQSAPRVGLIVCEYTGVNSSDPFEAETSTIDVIPPAVGPLITTNVNDLLFASSMSDFGDVYAWGAGSGYTLRQINPRMAVEDQVGVGPGSYSATFTASTGNSFVSQLAAFKLTVLPAPPVFTGVSHSGSTVTLNFTGGASALLWTTNVQTPPSNWMIYQAAPVSPVSITITNSSSFFLLKQ
jgi:hypothetical protein